jgi:surface protein
MKFNNETLKAAVKEWCAYESASGLKKVFLSNPEQKYGHISAWDVAEVTDTSTLFYNAKSFNQPLDNWDVSQVIKMTGMFSGAESFNQPLEKWDVSQVTNMSSMFEGTSEFNQPLEKWDVSQVTNMSFMFHNAKSFNQPLEKWDFSNVKNMNKMISGAKSFNQPELIKKISSSKKKVTKKPKTSKKISASYKKVTKKPKTSKKQIGLFWLLSTVEFGEAPNERQLVIMNNLIKGYSEKDLERATTLVNNYCIQKTTKPEELAQYDPLLGVVFDSDADEVISMPTVGLEEKLKESFMGALVLMISCNSQLTIDQIKVYEMFLKITLNKNDGSDEMHRALVQDAGSTINLIRKYLTEDKRHFVKMQRAEPIGDKDILCQLLHNWLILNRDTSDLTIGDSNVGETPWIYVENGNTLYHITSDTNVNSVMEFLENKSNNWVTIANNRVTNSKDKKAIKGLFLFQQLEKWKTNTEEVVSSEFVKDTTMNNNQSELKKTFWPNGQLKRTVPFVDDVQSDGEVISYHYNGLKSRSINISGGEYNGPITTWWENGNLKSKLLLKDDCPAEELIMWDPSGVVIGQHDASKYIRDGIDALNENNHLLSKELLDPENIFSDLIFDRNKDWNLKLDTQLMIIGEFDSEKKARYFQDQFVEQNHFGEKHDEDYWSKDEYDIVRRKNLIIIASRRYFDAKSIDFTYDDNAAEIVEIDWVQGVGLVQIPHDESDQLTFLTPTLILSDNDSSEPRIIISCEGSEFIAKYLCDQIIAMNGGANAFRLADNSNEFDLMFAFIGPDFFISIENKGVMIQKRRQDVQEDFWIKIVHDRAQSMDREKFKRWGVESLSDVASMHYQEYLDRISGESSAEKLEFCRIRMRGFGKAYENFNQQLDKEEYSDSLGREELDELIFHAHASFLGAMQIALDAGMKEDELKQITPENIMKQIQA